MNRSDILKKSRSILILLILLTVPMVTAGQYGAKYITNYSRKQYKSQPQNWYIQQDRRGIIYAANQGAVLEYDGSSWREILIPGKNVRSLAADGSGTIYAGGNNEIGYLKTTGTGLPQYTSLTHLLDKQYRQFGNVWRTYWTEQGVYFCTSKFLFLLQGQKIKVWRAATTFSPPFLCAGKLYLRQKDVGLAV